MGNILMTGSGGGGAGSDDCTATAAELHGHIERIG